MSGNTIGDKLRLTLFGQSHGPAIGGILEGYPAGQRIDWGAVDAFMARRSPGKNVYATGRREKDQPRILSGLNAEGLTCGTPLAFSIANQDARSHDYEALDQLPRPGHADFTARLKWGPAADLRGGGAFSGRLTAAICFAGALCLQYLSGQGVAIGGHIAEIAGIQDDLPDLMHPPLPLFIPGAFPVLNAEKGKAMEQAMEKAREDGDSVGGMVRCLITGLPGGLGGPLMEGLESHLAPVLFAIPGVRGLSFGEGFEAARMLGSQHNDPYGFRDGRCLPLSNHAGGILGGISTGLPLYFTVAMKPAASIAKAQQSVKLDTGKEEILQIEGRHDACFVPRAVPVVEAAAALVLADIMLQGE